MYSAALFYDEGTRGPTNTAIYTQLELRSDGAWHYSTSSGTWTVADIAASDWARWGSNPYGPTTKVVLNDWAGTGGDGPIELGTERVDFVWVIYHVEPPTVSKPGTVHLKFGHP